MLRLLCLLLALTATTAQAENAHHWAYDGAKGPDHWAEAAPDSQACAIGHEQSPINLAAALPAHAPDVAFTWNPETEWLVKNNGHTIQANPVGDAGAITIDGKTYALLQFHFHHPSEHTIDGDHSPMEVHFVHKSEDGALAVVGVMMIGGGPAGWFDTIMAAAPASEGESPIGRDNPGLLLPADHTFFRYAGSLTTPPCSEVVLWTVMKQPIAVSDASLQAFAHIFEMNARPIQPLNRRFLLTD
jgi:carbonic anhydrase